MITIPANTPFLLSTPIFALQKADTEPGDVTVKMAVEPNTEANDWTPIEETFSGTHVFHNYPSGLYLKCDHAVYFTGNVETPPIGTSTINVSAPTAGQIKVVDYRTKQPVNLSAVPNGTQVECIWVPAKGYVLISWSFTIGETTTTVSEERPVFTVTQAVTVAANLVHLPR